MFTVDLTVEAEEWILCGVCAWGLGGRALISIPGYAAQDSFGLSMILLICMENGKVSNVRKKVGRSQMYIKKILLLCSLLKRY